MALTDQERKYLNEALDACDAGLLGKPMLASVYERNWRANFRNRVLSASSMNDVTYPRAYAIPHFDRTYPSDLQGRIEEGCALFFPKLGNAERNHIIQRLRSGNMSAEEELLLARGIAAEFGEGTISGPSGRPDQARPEFTLRVDGIEIEVEAKGLFDSQETAARTRAVIESGQSCWVTGGDTARDSNRLRAAIVKGILQGHASVPKLIVLTQYTAWPAPPEGADLAHKIALKPKSFKLPDEVHPLGVAHVFQFLIQGIWLNAAVALRHRIPGDILQRMRSAVANSFYPRNDGIFLTEQYDEQTHSDLLRAMWAQRQDPS